MSILIGPVRPDLMKEETLADMFRASARAYPAKDALIFNNMSLSYHQLDRWSDTVASFLCAKGIGPGHSVGLWWPRSLELHVAILGIVKSGAAYVPLDREAPAERVHTVMMEVGASAIFTDADTDLGCAVLRVPVIPGEADIIGQILTPTHSEGEGADMAVSPLSFGEGPGVRTGPQPDDRAYVLYTSGSTGRPKGIPISHRQICHLVRSEQTLLEVGPEDRVYQGFSVSFDMWCEEVWIGLHAGATLWVADATTAKVIDELESVLRAQKITVLSAVPSLLAVMGDDIPTLRLVNAGGEACTPPVLARWATKGRKFFNSYGPTETTVSATFAALKPGDHITIGQPLPNYNMAVVDENLNLLPNGQKGELVISGPGVCAGYVNRPDLTAEKFVKKSPSLSELPGDIIYRTGDAAIINPDGSIDFQGRLDDQIKLRGYRIELGEIENQLNILPGISAAAVAVRKDNNGQDELVGYVVLNPQTPEGGLNANPDEVSSPPALSEGEGAAVSPLSFGEGPGVRTFDEQHLRSALAKVLPPYMVPGVIMPLAKMPRLPSGKIDRKSLPTPTSFSEKPKINTDEKIDANAPIGQRVLSVLKQVFPGRDIHLEEDFFTELGGHSLLAAAFVSRLRRDGGLQHASLRDVYQQRPLAKLVKLWEETKEESAASAPRPFHPVPWPRYIACWIAQSISLLFIYGLFAMQIFLPYLGYYYWQQETDSHAYAMVVALCLFCVIPPIFSFVSVLVKWTVIGRFKPGDYPLWGSYYFRWWLVNTMQGLVPMEFLNGTPLFPLYLRMMGVKVADDAQIGAIKIGAEDLVTIGSDASLSSGVLLNNAFVEDGMLKIREIKIGDHAYIGSSAIIAGGATMEDWGELQDLSFLPACKTIKSGEVWKGSPGQCVEKKKIEDMPQPLEVSTRKLWVYKAVFSIVLLIFPFAILFPLLPTVVALNILDNDAGPYDFSYLVWTPVLALSYVLYFVFQTVILTRVLQWRIKPGTYPVHGRIYIRKWLSEQLMALSLIVVYPVYATIYVTAMFRAFGAKVGKNTEISTANNVTHPMFEIGEESFIADAVTLGEADVRAQRLILDRTIIGSNSFVGNSALIPQGYNLPDNTLIGVLSTPPTKEQLETTAKSDWFGSPAIALPHRQQSYPYSRDLTHTPSIFRRIARGTIELIRILTPQTAIICLSVIFIAYGHDLIIGDPVSVYVKPQTGAQTKGLKAATDVDQTINENADAITSVQYMPSDFIAAKGPGHWRADANNPATVTFAEPGLAQTAVSGFTAPGTYYLYWSHPWYWIMFMFPLYYLVIIGLPAFLIPLILKWLLIGRYKEGRHPMWTWQVWRSEAVTSIYESLSKTFLLEYLKGTPWLPIAFRLMGTKVGKRVWLGTIDITEYDMVSIGDDSALNDDSGPQTHLFEDRVMKIGKVKIGARSSIGAKSIVLYDSVVGDDTRLEALSLVMKGENLANGTNWEGSPVKPQS